MAQKKAKETLTVKVDKVDASSPGIGNAGFCMIAEAMKGQLDLYEYPVEVYDGNSIRVGPVKFEVRADQRRMVSDKIAQFDKGKGKEIEEFEIEFTVPVDWREQVKAVKGPKKESAFAKDFRG